MRTRDYPNPGEAGFSLVELLVAMVIVLAIMGATLTSLKNAYRANESAKSVTSVNNNLRIGIDLMVRDLIQVGQGLPGAGTVQVPNGTGALQIQRPHPQGSTCTAWPAGTETISAVTPGPGCGPTINNVATDMVTTLAVDSSLEMVPVQSFNDTDSATSTTATSAVIAIPAASAGGSPVRVGDLIMFRKNSTSALVYVTAVTTVSASGGNQTFTFASGTADPMNLNQSATALNGTVDDLATMPPTTANSANASRVRMISYYLDDTLDATTPRLVRHMGWGDPTVVLNLRGMTVAFGIDNLLFSYDIRDSATNPSNVRMVAADLLTSGACNPNVCSPSQIRKVNVYLAARSARVGQETQRFTRNSLNTQVSLRSLALVDRYNRF
jgi:prepilin-type N-terminal cleavage/methylation domain-containing protein